jgi:hypothetical protein
MMTGSDFPQNRRRRRAAPNGGGLSIRNDPTVTNHMDDDQSDDEKGHRSSQEDGFFAGHQNQWNICHLAVHSTVSWWRNIRRNYGRGGDFRTLVIASMCFIVVIHFGRQLSVFDGVFKSTIYFSPHRLLKDRHADHMPILYNHFHILDDTDIGGWRSLKQHFFLPPEPVITSFGNSTMEPGDPDFGGLDLLRNPSFNLTTSSRQPRKNASSRPARKVQPNDHEVAEQFWIKTHRDTPLRNDYEPAEAIADKPKKCRRPSFKNRYYPSCNIFHEKDLSRDYDPEQAESMAGDDQVYDTFLINHGYYRDVWVVDQPSFRIKTIMKTMRWKHNIEHSTLMETLMDALVMERLTASPRIVDIYGNCGTAVWVEAIPFEVEEVIVHGDGYIKPEQLSNPELRSYNEYTPQEKLDMALAMAESLADMHGYPEGVM